MFLWFSNDLFVSQLQPFSWARNFCSRQIWSWSHWLDVWQSWGTMQSSGKEFKVCGERYILIFLAVLEKEKCFCLLKKVHILADKKVKLWSIIHLDLFFPISKSVVRAQFWGPAKEGSRSDTNRLFNKTKVIYILHKNLLEREYYRKTRRWNRE